MNINPVGGIVPVLFLSVTILTGIFWMVVGWRAMRAHERLAEAAERSARRIAESAGQDGPGI